MSPQLFTIGHSTHTLDEFVALLQQHDIAVLIDIRRYPGSRKFPHFNRDNLQASLPQTGIEYVWLENLGGRRKKAAGESNNLGLRNESFRNYADYMLTSEFKEGIRELLAIAKDKPAAYMCSESMFWSCHRRLVSDYLLAQGITVQHIMPKGELRPHTLTPGAKVKAKVVTYPAEGESQGKLKFD